MKPQRNDLFQRLRDRAEKALATGRETSVNVDTLEMDTLIHEIQVYQIQLEMQNEELLRTRQEIEFSRRKYLDLYEYAPVGYLTLDREGTILEANLRAAQMFQADRRFLVGRPFSSFTRDTSTLYRHREAVFNSDIRQVCVVELARVQEGFFSARLESQLSQSMENGALVWHCAMLDITDQCRAEESLKGALADANRSREETDALLRGARAVLENLDFAAAARAIFDECARITGARSGYVALLKEHEDANEILFLESGGLECSVDPELPMPVRGLREVAYAEGRPVVENDFMNSEWIEYMPEGHVVLDNVMFAPLLLDGLAVGVIGLANKDGGFDEDDLRISEGFAEMASVALRHGYYVQSLAESEQRFRSVTETASDAILLLNREGRVVYSNPRTLEVFGLEHDARGMDVDSLIPELGARLREDATAFEGGQATFLKTTGHRVDGSDFPLDVSLGCWPSGDDILVTAIARDVTETRLMENRLRQTHKMEAIGTLAGGIAHDFNNILGIILGNTEMAIDESVPGTDMHVCLEQSREACLRARDIVAQILAFSRKAEPERVTHYLEPLLRESIKLLRASIPSTVPLDVEVEPDLPPVLADAGQINQVLINLCTNASHALRGVGEGALSISLGLAEFRPGDVPPQGLSQGRYVRLSVVDNGAGIEMENLERIFDPYFTTKPVGEGTGMGLAVVHGIVKGHQGAVQVSSRPGAGARFDVFFPVAPAREEPEVVEEAAAQPDDRSVLFVDDEPAMVAIVGRMLERLGYRVTTEMNPETALELYSVNPDQYDLVITDKTMPGMTGDVLAGKILDIRPSARILLCTGYAEEVDEERVGELGLSGLVQKPLTLDALARAVRDALED